MNESKTPLTDDKRTEICVAFPLEGNNDEWFLRFNEMEKHARSLEVQLASVTQSAKDLAANFRASEVKRIEAERLLAEAKNALMFERNEGITDKFNHLCDERNKLAARVKLLESENAKNNAASVTWDLCVAQARVVELEKALEVAIEWSKALKLYLEKGQITNKEVEQAAIRCEYYLNKALQSSPSTALQHLQDLERKAGALNWLNTVDGMDWFSCCEYGDATLEAIEAAMKEK
jgi:hypothetical protein